MSDSGQITGWLFVDQKTQSIMFVSRNGDIDDTGVPWDLLSEPGNLEAFRRDFVFQEVQINRFERFKIEVEIASLKRWFEIRQEPR